MYFRKNRDHSGSREDPLQYCRSGTLVPYALHFGHEDNSMHTNEYVPCPYAVIFEDFQEMCRYPRPYLRAKPKFVLVSYYSCPLLTTLLSSRSIKMPESSDRNYLLLRAK